jgi:hypothetical protein
MDVRNKMNKEEVAKLIESIPQGLDQDDFLVALATKAKEQGMERFCCDDLCEQGRDCPVRNQARIQTGERDLLQAALDALRKVNGDARIVNELQARIDLHNKFGN